MKKRTQRSRARKPVQFDWRRHWARKVAPHLADPLVRASLDLGMLLLDPGWRSGDAPYLLGDGTPGAPPAEPGTLAWHRPFGRCHWIAFFAMAAGVRNYPRLDWRFVSGDLHTVPVGYQGDEPRVVLDILLFDALSAEGSLALARECVAGAAESKGWEAAFGHFVAHIVPVLRDTGRADPQSALRDLAEGVRRAVGTGDGPSTRGASRRVPA